MKSNVLKKTITNNKLLVRMILTFTSCIAIVVIILTSVLSYYFEKLSCEEIYKNSSSSINQASSAVQFLSQSVNGTLLQIYRDANVSKLFRSNQYGYNEIYSARRELDKIRYVNPKIHSIYIYNSNDQILYESGETSQNFTNDINYFYDESFVECLSNIHEYKRFAPIMRTVPVIRPNIPASTTKVFTYLYYEPYSNEIREKTNLIAINISTTWMSEALGYLQGYNSDANDIMIVNEAGQVIFSRDSNKMDSEFEDRNILNRILSITDDNGYIIDEDGANKQLVTYAKSSYIGYEDWIFISKNNYEEIVQPIQNTKKIMYGISGIALLLSIITSVIISLHFYNPIKNAMHKAELLEKEQQDKLKREAQRYLKQILEGNLSEDTKLIQANFQKLKINFNVTEENQLILISFGNLQSFKRKYRDQYYDKLQEAYDTINKIFEEWFGAIINVNLQDGTSVIVIQVGSDEREDKSKKIENVFDIICKELSDKIQCSISMSISSLGQSIKDLPYLLAEALDIQTYRYLYGYGKLLTADRIKIIDNENYVYPKECEKDIITNLFGGKLDDTNMAYNKYIEYLTSMSISEIKISFLQLAYAIKHASKNTTVEASNTLINFEQFFSKIQSLETIFEVNHMFVNLFQEIVEVIEVQLKAKYDDLIDYVKNQVQADYGDVNLSIKEIAEKVDMSAAYLGRVFKQQTGIAFTEYLTKYRLDVACHELLHTNKTINEISDETGFTNSSYFYLVFKKNLEITPSQYRKNANENKR